MQIFHWMACLSNQPIVKLVSDWFSTKIRSSCISFLIDKMKQYLEQLRKECSDRMVDRVIDPETDKPSKVMATNVFFFDHGEECILVVALLCSSSFYGQKFIKYWIIMRNSFSLYFSHVPCFQNKCNLSIRDDLKGCLPLNENSNSHTKGSWNIQNKRIELSPGMEINVSSVIIVVGYCDVSFPVAIETSGEYLLYLKSSLCISIQYIDRIIPKN